MKRIMVVAMVAASFAGASVPSAEAGPLRDALKHVVLRASDVAHVGLAVTRCALKGHPGTVLC